MEFSKAQKLERFYLPGLRGVGTQLGHGSFAVVVEFQLHGLKCAGKKLQIELCNTNPEERERLVSRFEEECILLSSIRHPNIVQFLGLSHDKETDTPILVMEYLEASLTSCINSNGILPDELNYSIINDVIIGLCFLHGQAKPIVHRDLTPNNVLLTAGMKAKIADLGVAKILNFGYFRRFQMTTCPGTSSYMPPEALAHNCVYNCSIDIFAVGILILHMFCGEWPIPGEANRVDPQNPTKLIPLTEKERRFKYISKLSPAHPLLSTVEQCLSNYPPHRPTAEEVLEKVRAFHEPEKMNKLEMTKKLNQLSSDKEDCTYQKDELVQALESVTKTKESLEEVARVKDDALAAKEKQLTAKEVQLTAMETQLRAMKDQLQAMKEEVAAHETEISIKDGLLTEKPQPTTNKGIPFQFRLKYCKDFQKKVIGNPNCIVFQNTLYVGAGHSEIENDCHLIFSYDTTSDSWNQLPPTPHALFGLGHLDCGIVAVGGKSSMGYTTREMFMFNSNTQKWRRMHPDMPTARFRPTIVSHSNAIAVCGGIGSDSRVSECMEVFSSGSNHWHFAPPLTIPCAITKPLIIGNHCYLVGGYKQWRPGAPTNAVQYIPLSSIFEPGAEEGWKLLPDTPNDRPVPISVGGALVVIGGWSQDLKNEIYAFSEKLNKWIQIGAWPVPFRSGGSATLPSGEIMVIGGLVDNREDLLQVVIVSLQLLPNSLTPSLYSNTVQV